MRSSNYRCYYNKGRARLPSLHRVDADRGGLDPVSSGRDKELLTAVLTRAKALRRRGPSSCRSSTGTRDDLYSSARNRPGQPLGQNR
jgi:hypothetical protein